MSHYSDRWSLRPEKVDCLTCKGDETTVGVHTVIHPGGCCAKTGLDEIPWSELFRKGRKQWKGYKRDEG